MDFLNFQTPLNFEFDIPKLFDTPPFVQEVAFPGLYCDAVGTGTTFAPIKHVGDSVAFDPLVVTLKLDEAMKNWFELFKWTTGLGRPESFEQFDLLEKNNVTTLDGARRLFRGLDKNELSGPGYRNLKSTAVLSVKDCNYISYFDLVFIDLFPTGISGFQFVTDDTMTQFLTYQVTFAYNFYYPRLAR
jgi:hypothetical protein